jgi:hypothetical protein
VGVSESNFSHIDFSHRIATVVLWHVESLRRGCETAAELGWRAASRRLNARKLNIILINTKLEDFGALRARCRAYHVYVRAPNKVTASSSRDSWSSRWMQVLSGYSWAW